MLTQEPFHPETEGYMPEVDDVEDKDGYDEYGGESNMSETPYWLHREITALSYRSCNESPLGGQLVIKSPLRLG